MKYGSSAYPASADSYEFDMYSLARLREREKSLSLTSKEEKQKAANPLQD